MSFAQYIFQGILFFWLFSHTLVLSSILPHHRGHNLESLQRKALQGSWYQPVDHPVRALFGRHGRFPEDDSTYPAVGSPEWIDSYPKGKPDITELPSPWVEALDIAISQGKIPDIPPSYLEGGSLKYPGDLDPMSSLVCSTAAKCSMNPEVWWDVPDGVWALSFDDGPLPASDRLYNFLEENKEHATHFFVGEYILQYPQKFLMAFERLEDDIAIHTWTHPYMTTLSNLEIVAELGWTMAIIHDSTGGRIPAYWRPPFGDSDNRVNAIAKEVFGLTTVMWNRDTQDWGLSSGLTSLPQIERGVDEWLKGPKSPGLMVLEHEVDDDAVQAFINVYPSINENGWQVVSLARFNNPNSLQTPPDHTLDTDIDDNTNKEYQDTPPPIPFQPLESSSSFLEGLRPDRFYRVWDEEAYLQFGGVRLVSMIVIILLCVLIFSSTVHVCGCCSRRKGKIQIE